METQNRNTVTDEIDELFDRPVKEKRVLGQLLERFANQQGKYLATRGEMGEYPALGGKSFRIPSFVVSHDLNWIATNVKMGSEMPFMQSYIKDGKLTIDESNVDELKQRQPDWSRQASLTAYLAHDRTRKFGSILAVISPEWVDNPQHENWGKDGRANKSAVNFEPLDLSGRVGLLDLNDTFIYALDGQHRVMGLRGIKELIENSFAIRNKDDTHAQKISREEFLESFNLQLHSLQALMSERMHVEYIPAVLPGETRPEASRRVRSVFVAINSHAKKPTKGENYLLEEVDGYSVVARKAGVRHPLFKSREGKSRINWKSSALPDRSEWYTTLEAIREMSEAYLSKIDPKIAKDWSPRFKDVRLRPNEEELEHGAKLMSDFFDKVHTLPVFQNLERSANLVEELGEYRAFPEQDKPKAHGHLLLRPIGQIVLATAVGRLVDRNSSGRMSLDEVFEALRVLDSKGRFEAHRPENLWYGVTYNSHKNKMDVAVSNRALAVDLLVYLVRGADEAERTRLIREIVLKREVEGEWRPFDGTNRIPVVRDEIGEIITTGISLPLPRS